MSDAFDVIVIGTGAGGGTLTHTIAQTGKRILLLERGDFLTRELGNWDPGFFPSIGAVNPALTAIANAIRVGEHIAERLGASTATEMRAPAPSRAPAWSASAITRK